MLFLSVLMLIIGQYPFWETSKTDATLLDVNSAAIKEVPIPKATRM